jgi:competence protein ComEC
VDVAPWLVVDTPSAAALVRAPAPAAGPPGSGPLLVVSFLDVGQGDATLVQFPSGAAMLVDAGGAAGTSFDIGGRVIVPAVRALGANRLTWLALTHGDPDHISGAGRVVEQLRPAELWEGVAVPRHAPLADVFAVAQERGMAIRNVIAGDLVRIDGVEVRVVHPPPPTWERQRVRNDDSIVIELRYGDVQILLPGDIGDATEGQVLERIPRGGRVVVKAAHHGSRTSSGRAWVSALRPDVVVYSAGRDNRFGHPAPDVAARYAQVGAQAFRTDRDGAIRVATDGTQVWAVTMDGRRWWKGGGR